MADHVIHKFIYAARVFHICLIILVGVVVDKYISSLVNKRYLNLVENTFILFNIMSILNITKVHMCRLSRKLVIQQHLTFHHTLSIEKYLFLIPFIQKQDRFRYLCSLHCSQEPFFQMF